MDSKIKELLQEIIVKAYEVNKSTKHDINICFYGTTNELDVFYYKNGFNENGDSYTRIDNAYLGEENAEGKLQFILKELDKLERNE